MMTTMTFAKLLAALLMRPWLWVTAIRQAYRLAPSRWWTRAPYLPLPTPAYVQFRTSTQYGGQRREPEVYDIIDYLEWARDWHSTTRLSRRGRRG
ncbi:MAG: hypothetical protein ABR57_05760 [Acidimicrobium sp. BACL17 MAG-120924-bin0]|jgi:hypothetical protein|nr:MAG: hypothetical protein ABR57_05760 [Acidimicrobium sp. BACL17 MAG-120924-bin0]